MAAWLWRALDALKINRAFLVGHSMGALVSLEAAKAHPQRAAGLMLVGFAPKMPVHPDLLNAAKANDPKASELIAKTRALLIPSEDGAGFARRYFEVLQRDANAVLAHRDMLKVLD